MRLIDADRLNAAFLADSVNFKTEEFYLSTIEAEIDGCPTVDAVPVVHGRWEKIPLNMPVDRYGMNKHNMRIKCTACGFVTAYDFIGVHYCHCCGARMDAKEEHSV